MFLIRRLKTKKIGNVPNAVSENKQTDADPMNALIVVYKCYTLGNAKWLPLYYSFVRIQYSLTNLVRDNKFFTIFVSKTRLVRLI